MGSKRLFLPPEEKLPSLSVRKLSAGEGPTLQRKAGRGTEPAAVPGALRKPWKSVCPEEKEVAECLAFPCLGFPAFQMTAPVPSTQGCYHLLSSLKMF